MAFGDVPYVPNFPPLPISRIELPQRRGKFIDIEVFGSIEAGGTITGSIISTDATGSERVEISDTAIKFINSSDVTIGEIWFAESSSAIGIEINGSLVFAAASGEIQARGDNGAHFFDYSVTATGSAANATWVNASGSIYFLERSTSARKYKRFITHPEDELADMELKPSKFWRDDDQEWYYGFIADDLADEDPILGIYEKNDSGVKEIDNYDHRGVLAVLAAKVNRLERQLPGAPGNPGGVNP